MKKTNLMLCATFSMIAIAGSALGAVADYAMEAVLTVAGAANGVSLANFPVLVRISESRIDGFAYSQLSSPTDGADLRFTDEDGNFLNHDIDTWNPDGESLVWVSVPTLANGETIIMRWGNETPAEVNDSAAVWSAAGYVQVWHFSTGVTTDATGRGLSLTLSPTGIAANSSDLLGGCYTNDNTAAEGVQAYIDLPGHDALLDSPSNRTITAWYRPDENFHFIDGTVNILFTNKRSFNNAGLDCIYFNHNIRIRTTGQSNFTQHYRSNCMQIGTWAHVGAVLIDNDDSLDGTIFKDGQRFAQGSSLSETAGAQLTSISAVDGVFTIGNFSGAHDYGNYPFHGDMDEFRVNRTVLSDEWMKEEYATVATDGYLTYGMADLRPYVAFLRADESDTLPAAYGVPEATFSDVEAAVAATVAAKNGGRPSATLYIAPGTYRAQNDALRATNGVSIVGIGAREETILTGPEGSDSTAWNHRVLLLSDGGFLANVTILGTYRTAWDSADSTTDSWNRWGSTLMVEGNGTIASNIVVRDARAIKSANNEFCGAVAVRDYALLTDSTVCDNSGSYIGAGVYVREYAIVRRCIVANNSAIDVNGGTSSVKGGGVFINGRGALVDCLIVSNRCTKVGGAIYHQYGQTDYCIYNCTIADNSAASHGAIYANQHGTIANTIIYGNTSDDGSCSITNTQHTGSSKYYLVNNLLQEEPPEDIAGYASDTNLIGYDPRFKNAANGDYTLRGGSPCIDAGENTARAGLGTPSTWLALNYVPHCHNDETDTWDGAPDIGCYESTNVRQDATVVVFR